MTPFKLSLLWWIGFWGCSAAAPEGEPLVQVAAPTPAPVIPAVTEELMHASYWLTSQPSADALLLTQEQVPVYQQELRQGSYGSLTDLADYPQTLEQQTLKDRLDAWAPEVEVIFQDGKPLDKTSLEAAAPT